MKSMNSWMIRLVVIVCCVWAVGQPGYSQDITNVPAKTNTAINASMPAASPISDRSVQGTGEPVDQPTGGPDQLVEAPSDEPRVDINVSPQGNVEMHVRSQDLASVLQMLSMESKRNIVASPNVSGAVTANLYGVTFEEALTAILDGNGCGWRERGRFIYVYTNEELLASEKQIDTVTTRVFRLSYARAEDVQVLVQSMLSEAGSLAVTPAADSGIGSDGEDAGGNSYATEDCLVVTDLPEKLKRVESLIREIDVRPRQVLIEATLLRASLNEQNQIGIDFNVVGGIDFTDLSATSQAVQDLTVGQLAADDFSTSARHLSTDFAGNVNNGGLTFGMVGNDVSVFVRALEQVTDVTVMANPKILALNKHRGEMIVGRRDGYRTTTVTETAAVENVEFLETGTRLIFRPFIGDDGCVRMEIHPEDSTGGITAANLPFEQTTEVTTNVMVKDGHTILIGGLFREVTTAGRNQIPGFGNIPILGALARNTDDHTEREEVVILLTVHIIKDETAFAEASEELLQDVERYRVGMRQGLQWFGRERLSQAHYQWALEHLSKGHTSKALWDLDLSINNNPKMLSAIELKEKLIDQRAWSEDGSAIRDFVVDQIMQEEGVVTPLFGRPGPPFEFPTMRGPSGFDDTDCEKSGPVSSKSADVTDGGAS